MAMAASASQHDALAARRPSMEIIYDGGYELELPTVVFPCDRGVPSPSPSAVATELPHIMSELAIDITYDESVCTARARAFVPR